MKPRKVYGINDPALFELVKRRPRYVNVATRDSSGREGWCRLWRPRIQADLFGPVITGKVMVNPRYQAVLHS